MVTVEILQGRVIKERHNFWKEGTSREEHPHISSHCTYFIMMFKIQIQWIRPAQDASVLLLQTILFLQCLNKCIDGNSDRAA